MPSRMLLGVALAFMVAMGMGTARAEADTVQIADNVTIFDGPFELTTGELDLSDGSRIYTGIITIDGGTLAGDRGSVFGTMGGLGGLVGLLDDLGLDFTGDSYDYAADKGLEGLLDLLDEPLGMLLAKQGGLGDILAGDSGLLGLVDGLLDSIGLTDENSDGLVSGLLGGLGLGSVDELLDAIVGGLLEPGGEGLVSALLVGPEGNGGIMDIKSGTLSGDLNLIAGKINLNSKSGAVIEITTGSSFNILGNLNLGGIVKGDLTINSLLGAFDMIAKLEVQKDDDGKGGNFILNDLTEDKVFFDYAVDVAGNLVNDTGLTITIGAETKVGGYVSNDGTLELDADFIFTDGGEITDGIFVAGDGALKAGEDGDKALDILGGTFDITNDMLKLAGETVRFGDIDGDNFVGDHDGEFDIEITGNFGVVTGKTATIINDVHVTQNVTINTTETLILAGGGSLTADGTIDISGGTLATILGAGDASGVEVTAGTGMTIGDNSTLNLGTGTEVTVNITTGDLHVGSGVTSTGDGTGTIGIGGNLVLDDGDYSSLGGLGGLEITIGEGKIKDGEDNILFDLADFEPNEDGEQVLDDLDGDAFHTGGQITIDDKGKITIHEGDPRGNNLAGLDGFMNARFDTLGISSDSRGFVSATFIANSYYAGSMSSGARNALNGNTKENVELLASMLSPTYADGSATRSLSGAEALAVGQSLSGQAGAMTTAVGANTSREAADVVGGRVEALRMEVTAANAVSSSDAFPAVCYYDPVAASSVNRFWLSGFGMWEDADNYKGYAGYEYNSGGMMIGYDRFLSQNFAVGGSFGYTDGSFENKMALGNDSSIESYSVNAYGAFFHSSGFFATGKVGYTYSDNDISTMRTYANGWEDMENSTNSWYIGSNIGYDWRPSETLALTFTPSVGLYYYNSTGTGFTSSKGISYDDQKRRTWSLPIDLAVRYDIPICEDGVLTLGGHVGYAYDFNGDGTTTAATIEGVNFAPMDVEGRSSGRHQINLGTSAKYAWKQFEVGANYDYFHRAEYDGHRLGGNFAINF